MTDCMNDRLVLLVYQNKGLILVSLGMDGEYNQLSNKSGIFYSEAYKQESRKMLAEQTPP